MPGNQQRREWREEAWPKGNLPNKTRPGHRAGKTRSARWTGTSAAKKESEVAFTALLHHIYDPETLRKAYFSLKKEAAPGVDGETWRHYGGPSRTAPGSFHRLKRGAYRAKPVRRGLYPTLRASSLCWRQLLVGQRPARYIDLRTGLARYAPRFSLWERSWRRPRGSRP